MFILVKILFIYRKGLGLMFRLTCSDIFESDIDTANDPVIHNFI